MKDEAPNWAGFGLTQKAQILDWVRDTCHRQSNALAYFNRL